MVITRPSYWKIRRARILPVEFGWRYKQSFRVPHYNITTLQFAQQKTDDGTDKFMAFSADHKEFFIDAFRCVWYSVDVSVRNLMSLTSNETEHILQRKQHGNSSLYSFH